MDGYQNMTRHGGQACRRPAVPVPGPCAPARTLIRSTGWPFRAAHRGSCHRRWL